MKVTDTDDHPVRSLMDFVSRGSVVMVASGAGPNWSARPLTCAAVDGNVARFLVNRSAKWLATLGAMDTPSPMTLIVSDPGRSTFVSANGQATVYVRRSEVDSLWSPATACFFDGPDDPQVGILRMETTAGQWWSGSESRVGRVFAIARAAVTNDPEVLAERGRVG